MRHASHFFSAFLLLSLFFSCKERGQSRQSGYPNQFQTDLIDTGSIITDYKTIFSPKAPTRITRQIRQDSKGNLLIAAYEAVIRYDGKSFWNITKEAGLDDPYAFDVLEDRAGNIWIASDQTGVFRIGLTGTVTHFTTDDGLAHNRNMCIYEDRKGHIWIGGQGGISRYDGVTFTNFTTEDGLPHHDINTIVQDRTGKLWIGTRGNACIYDGKTFTEILNDKGEPLGNVWSFMEDQNGNIWYNSDGLWRYDGDSFTHVTTLSGICIYEDQNGNIWFNPGHTGQYESGLSRFEAKSLLHDKPEATHIFQSNGTFLGISEDREGHLWIGGGDGIWRYDGKSVHYFTGKQGKDSSGN